MTPNNKILSVALAAAVLGGTTVALVNHSPAPKIAENTPTVATTTTQPATDVQPTDNTAPANNLATTQPQPLTNDQIAANTSGAKDDQGGYREGYTQGLNDASRLQPIARSTVSPRTVAAPPARAATRTRYANSAPRYSNSSERRAYYDYSQPRKRTFWQKHRDKLTVAGGTAGGAIIGGLIGGKKGAAIGAVSGAGGGALYTYKIRNKNRRY